SRYVPFKLNCLCVTARAPLPWRDGLPVRPQTSLARLCVILQAVQRRSVGYVSIEYPSHPAQHLGAIRLHVPAEDHAEYPAVMAMVLLAHARMLADAYIRQRSLGAVPVTLPKLRRVDALQADLHLLAVHQDSERVAVMNTDDPAGHVECQGARGRPQSK